MSAVAAFLIAAVHSARPGDEPVDFELRAPAECYVQQPVRLELRVTYDPAWFREHAVQLFARELDLPVQIDAPFLEAMPGAVVRAEPATVKGASVTLALGDRRIAASVVDAAEGTNAAHGRRRVVTIERTILLLEAGELVIPAPVLRLVRALESGGDDLVTGSRATERVEREARGAPHSLRVLPLPAEGRPATFGGAVGRFEVRAEATPREVAVGASLALVLTIEGEGNLELFDAPKPSLDGFHVYGVLEQKAAMRRTTTYDLAPQRAELREIPPIELAWFDPEARAYRSAQTESIPIVVRAAAGNASEPPVLLESEPAAPGKRHASFPWWTIGVAAGLGAFAALAIRARRRRPS